MAICTPRSLVQKSLGASWRCSIIKASPTWTHPHRQSYSSFEQGEIPPAPSLIRRPSKAADLPAHRHGQPKQKNTPGPAIVHIPIAGQTRTFAAGYLRDLCKCSRCRDPSTRQKLFLTADVQQPTFASSVKVTGDSVFLTWGGAPQHGGGHVTELSIAELAYLSGLSETGPMPSLPDKRLWLDAEFRKDTVDIPFAAYMQDDSVLLKALRQLHTHGLAVLTNVPETSESVSQIAERIGPLKNTFYGSTWDVRSIPSAKNVAYTSQDLGFHMDLLYMRQPPHLQFLHCIRSSSQGGASLFADSFRAARHMYIKHEADFSHLTEVRIPYHYSHADTGHYYTHSHPVISMKDLTFRKNGEHATYRDMAHMGRITGNASAADAWTAPKLAADFPRYIDGVAWSPPFQAPLPTSLFYNSRPNISRPLGADFAKFHKAARIFNSLVHSEDAVYERLMKPGECVLFDNRRVLHARRGFEPGDEGKERWLRGAYVDRDPFESRLRVLTQTIEAELGQVPWAPGLQ